MNTHNGTPLKRLIEGISKLWRLAVRPLPALKEAPVSHCQDSMSSTLSLLRILDTWFEGIGADNSPEALTSLYEYTLGLCIRLPLQSAPTK